MRRDGSIEKLPSAERAIIVRLLEIIDEGRVCGVTSFESGVVQAQ